MKIAIVGGNGFVGSWIREDLQNQGHEVVDLGRITLPEVALSEFEKAVSNFKVAAETVAMLQGIETLINAAGNPDASSSDELALMRSNGLLPGILGKICSTLDVQRYVHVSSAVVQGAKETLDSSDVVSGFSPYARSKILGEQMAQRFGPTGTIVYRPPSVHHESRRVSQQLYKIANSPLSSVASPGNTQTPQAHILDVTEAVSILATEHGVVPKVVHHPWQGLTSSSLLEYLSEGKRPRLLPRVLCLVAVKLGYLAARLLPSLRPNVRRVELIWFGQPQGPSWLDDRMLDRLEPDERWHKLAQALRQASK